ncbi:hypothetical protein BH09VER1_BH09VER1_27330 [soil metagenome]
MKEQILLDLANSRRAMSRDYRAVRHELDYKAKLESSIKLRPFAWFGGAAALGWLLAGPKTKTQTRTITKYTRGDEKLPKPKETKAVGRIGFFSILLTVIRLAFPLLKPALSGYALRRIGEFAERYAK